MKQFSPPKNPFFRAAYLLTRRFLRHNVGAQSAALAFYLLFMLFPFLIFLSALLGLLHLDVAGILSALAEFLPAQVVDVADVAEGNAVAVLADDLGTVVVGICVQAAGAGYNVHQSEIAIGSGGLEGKGFLNGTQTKLKFVPEQDTDFIFCTVGEEEGFLGSSAVLLLFLSLILRLIHLAERQPMRFGRIYGYSVVSIFLFHLFINVGMVLGLTPVIGIPLPFFSYGGSSLWGFTFLLFIFLRIDASREMSRR